MLFTFLLVLVSCESIRNSGEGNGNTLNRSINPKLANKVHQANNKEFFEVSREEHDALLLNEFQQKYLAIEHPSGDIKDFFEQLKADDYAVEMSIKKFLDQIKKLYNEDIVSNISTAVMYCCIEQEFVNLPLFQILIDKYGAKINYSVDGHLISNSLFHTELLADECINFLQYNGANLMNIILDISMFLLYSTPKEEEKLIADSGVIAQEIKQKSQIWFSKLIELIDWDKDTIFYGSQKQDNKGLNLVQFIFSKTFDKFVLDAMKRSNKWNSWNRDTIVKSESNYLSKETKVPLIYKTIELLSDKISSFEIEEATLKVDAGLYAIQVLLDANVKLTFNDADAVYSILHPLLYNYMFIDSLFYPNEEVLDKEVIRITQVERVLKWLLDHNIKVEQKEVLLELLKTGHPLLLIKNNYIPLPSANSILVSQSKQRMIQMIENSR